MIVYNYTKVKKREKRIYSLFNTTISTSGLSVNSLKLSGIMLLIFGVFGIIFCLITGTNWYNPIAITKGSQVGYFYVVFVFAPIGIGMALNTMKIQNYRAIDYLKMYFMPKPVLDQNGKKVKLVGYKQDTFIEKI